MSDLTSWEDQPLNLTAKGPSDCPRVMRGLVCNTIRTALWAHPEKCECEIEKENAEAQRQRENAVARTKHLSDIETLNQNARGK